METLLNGVRACDSISPLTPVQEDITGIVETSPEVSLPYKARPVSIFGDLNIKLRRVVGLSSLCRISLAIEVDRYGQFYKAFSSRVLEPSPEPCWDGDEAFIDLECSSRLKFYLFKHSEGDGKVLLHTKILDLTSDLLKSTGDKKRVNLGPDIRLSFCHRFAGEGPTMRVRSEILEKISTTHPLSSGR